MKKSFLIASILATVTFSNSCKLINDLALSRANNIKKTFKLDKVTAYKVEKIDYMLHDVLKTDEQLVPKHCFYINITGIKNEEFEIAKKAIQVCVLANSTINPNVHIFVDENQEAKEKILNLIKEYEIKNVYLYNSRKNMLSKILNLKGKHTELDHRRILLLTSSKNMRVEYSKLINLLEDNKENMVIDNFAYLYNASRNSYEFSTKEEILNSYKQINCK